MAYIEEPSQSGKSRKNPFVELPQSGDDRKALILYRSTHTFLILNKFPYNPGHLMAIPFREVADLEDLSVEERSDLIESVTKGKKILGAALHPDGFNIGINLGIAGGAGIPKHLHIHIVPRWNGDTNFMPVTGKTRVLPQALDETWERLTAFA